MGRGQVAFEFSFMVALAMILMAVMLVIIVSLSYRHSQEERRDTILELGRSIQDELILAASVHPGYIHEFTLPERAGRFAYTLANDAKYIEIRSTEMVFTFPTPPFTGTLAIGSNTIQNIDGEVAVT